MSRPKISVIVPVYKAEAYLCRCVDSILSQTFEDFELLLIDDGSPDRSGEICDEYAKRDCRVRVFHKENGGVSSARNVGIDNAIGEWIWFMDADDEVDTTTLRNLSPNLDKGYDCIMFGFERIENKIHNHQDVNPKVITLNPIEAIKCMYQPLVFSYEGFVWTKLFKASIIHDNHIYFDESIKYNEDRLFCIIYFMHIKLSVLYDTRQFYRYYINANSAMSIAKNTFNPDFLTDLVASLRMRDMLCENYSSLVSYARQCIVRSAISNIVVVLKNRIKNKCLINNLCGIARENFVISDYTIKDMTFLVKLMIIFIVAFVYRLGPIKRC